MTRDRFIGLLLAGALVLALVAGHRAGPSGVASAAPNKGDFLVEIAGVKAGFYSVDGISIENEVLEYRSGTDDTVRKLPGRTKYSNITLKRGFNGGTSALEEWHQSIVDGTAAPDKIHRDMTLTLYNQQGKPIAQWSLFSAFPVSFAVGSSPENTGMAIEKIEIAVEKVERAR